MNSLAFPRALWRRRILVSLGAVLAFAVAVKVGAGVSDGRALAKVGVLLDTPQSQLTNVDPPRVESLTWRANLLSLLLATEPARRQLAREAGIPAQQLAVVNSDLATPIVPASLPLTAAGRGQPRRGLSVVRSQRRHDPLDLARCAGAGP